MIRLPFPTVLIALLVSACGQDTTSTPEAPAGTDAGVGPDAASACGSAWDAACAAASCDPASEPWSDCRINGWAGYAAPPYCSVSTKYGGDDVALCAPVAKDGVQLHYGPSSYDDPAELEKFLLQPGGESTDCLFVRAPAKQGVFFGQYIGRSRPGVHHLQLSYAAAADDGREEGSVGACGSIASTQFIAIAQSGSLDVPDLDIERPADATDQGGLDFQGSAAPVDAGRMFELTAHFVNTTQKPQLREAWVNLYYQPADSVVAALEPISLISFGISVPPKSAGTVFRRACATSVERTLSYLQGHSHEGMRRFTIWQHDAAKDALQQIYESYDPLEPATLYYSDLVTNDAADPGAETPGGKSGTLSLAAGDSLVWECEFDNATTRTVHDGGPAQGDQMCYTFGAYITPVGEGANWTCLAASPTPL